MSTNDTHDFDDETTKLPDVDVPTSSVSRRTLMKTAAGVGVAAAAVGVVGVASAASTPESAHSDQSSQGSTTASASGPVVLHITDFHAGTIEVFNGWSRTQITDPDLASRIARAARA
jgi:hypothetical protein